MHAGEFEDVDKAVYSKFAAKRTHRWGFAKKKTLNFAERKLENAERNRIQGM